ncbi:hypothetical protein GCM10028791_36930 [Echinicola sediminis]
MLFKLLKPGIEQTGCSVKIPNNNIREIPPEHGGTNQYYQGHKMANIGLFGILLGFLGSIIVIATT